MWHIIAYFRAYCHSLKLTWEHDQVNIVLSPQCCLLSVVYSVLSTQCCLLSGENCVGTPPPPNISSLPAHSLAHTETAGSAVWERAPSASQRRAHPASEWPWCAWWTGSLLYMEVEDRRRRDVLGACCLKETRHSALKVDLLAFSQTLLAIRKQCICSWIHLHILLVPASVLRLFASVAINVCMASSSTNTATMVVTTFQTKALLQCHHT